MIVTIKMIYIGVTNNSLKQEAKPNITVKNKKHVLTLPIKIVFGCLLFK